MENIGDKLLELKPLIHILKIGELIAYGFWVWHIGNASQKANCLADELEKNGFEVKR